MTELTDALKAFLEEPRFAVLATINADGTPQLTTMWFELQGDHIMMNTAAGRIKEKNLKRDPRISFCVEDGYRYLTVKGHAELDYDQVRAQADIKALAVRYHGEVHAEQMSLNQFSKQQRITVIMSIESVDAHGF